MVVGAKVCDLTEAKQNWFVWTKICQTLSVYMEYYVGNKCFNTENVWNYVGCLHFSMESSEFESMCE